MTPLKLEEFLKLVWPSPLLTNETLELRAIDRVTKQVYQGFATSIENFIRMAEEYRDYEVYFGVSTRFGLGGKKKDCYRCKVVWADFDNFKLNNYPKPEEMNPQIIVESGGGLHAYWILDRSILVKDERWEDIESINRAIAIRLKADIGAIDISRVLRVPSYLNHKYSPPKKVKAYIL